MSAQNSAIQERNRKAIHRWIDEAINKGKVDVLDELLAPDYVYHGPGQDLHGPAALKQMILDFGAAFPDLNATIEDMVVKGEKVATRFAMTGTHRGAFMGIAPTGKCIGLSVIVITHFQNGKAVEDWEAFDTQGMMQQLGALPATE